MHTYLQDNKKIYVTLVFTSWGEHSPMKQQKHLILLNITILCLIMKVMKESWF